MWLARFSDKMRLHLAAELSTDFEPFFGHRLATDGTFLDFFALDLPTILKAARDHPTDVELGAWFSVQPGATPDRVAAWNQLGPKLGLPGEPMERAFNYARRKYYGGDNAHPGVISVFTGIAWDEGYLDRIPPLT